MKFHHHSACNAFLFSIIKPGGESLATAIDKWTGGSTSEFIRSILETQFIYNAHELSRHLHTSYFVAFDAKGCPRYSLKKSDSVETLQYQVDVLEEHPLRILLKQYEESLALGNGFIPPKETVLNINETYKCAQELLDTAYLLYTNGKSVPCKEIRDKFLNLIKDPLCLVATILGRYDADNPIIKNDRISTKDTLHSDSLESYLLGPESIRASTNGEILQLETSSLSVRKSESEIIPVEDLNNSDKLHFNLVPKVKEILLSEPSYSLKTALLTVLRSTPTSDDKKFIPTKQQFLLMCLAELPEKIFFNETLQKLLAYVYTDSPFDQSFDLNKCIDELRTKQYPVLLSMFMKTVSSLFSNIMGFRIIANQFKNHDLANSPKLFITNCSLDDIYSKDKRTQMFISILKNLNTKYEEQNRHNPVGLCILPRVKLQNNEADLESDLNDELWDIDLDVQIVNNSLGDNTSFGNVTKFLRDCFRNNLQIMNLISCDEPITDIKKDHLSVGGILRELSNSLKNNLKDIPDILKYVTICAPDATLLPPMTCNIQNISTKIPPMPIKSAVLVAAILMRNDQPELLKLTIPSHSSAIQIAQPGVGVGPQALWCGAEMRSMFRPIFLLPEVVSAMDYDVEILDQLLSTDSTNTGYSFLVQARTQPIYLRVFNTLAVDNGGRPIAVQDVRRNDYLLMLKHLFSSVSKKEWDNFETESRLKFKQSALHYAEPNLPFINAIY